jgi:Zn-dependent protease with chaperone function
MLTASVGLAVLALLLAWPVPMILAGASWQARSPGAALVLWQAIALAGGLSMTGALWTFGLVPFGPDLGSANLGLLGALTGEVAAAGVEFWHIFSLAAALLLGAHLLLNLVITVSRSEVQRRRHSQLIALLSSPVANTPGARMIDSPAPVAYCLPGPLRSITVFSAGLVAILDEEELRAVIEHERAHVEQRHDIVLILFRAWHASLPWFPIAYRSQRQVGRLVEMLADDRARRVVDDAVLARAIVLTATAETAPAALPVQLLGSPEPGTADELSQRLRRLDGTEPLPRPQQLLVVAAAVALIAVPTGLLAAPVLATWFG